MGRVTIDGQTKAFSLHLDADPNLWDAKANRMTGKSKSAQSINREIEKYKQKIDTHYSEILYNGGYITAELVKNALENSAQKQSRLLKLFEEHNDEFRSRIGIDKAQNTYKTYRHSYNYLSDFIRQKFNREDIPLNNLSLFFIESYDFYLRIDRNMKSNTVCILMVHLKKIVNRAIKQGSLKKNPFLGYASAKSETLCRHLQTDELERIMKMHIASKSLCYLRDIFVFSCFTGLAYADVCKLSEENLKTENDGRIWICIERQKSKTECNIPLMKLPLQIIEKYRPKRKDGKLFKTIPMGSLTSYFRQLSRLCNVQPITFHMARHTFATQICLSHGVSIASISKVLGHTSIKTTQIYAKITNQKINEDMKILSEKMKGKYVLSETSGSKSESEKQNTAHLKSNN